MNTVRVSDSCVDLGSFNRALPLKLMVPAGASLTLFDTSSTSPETVEIVIENNASVTYVYQQHVTSHINASRSFCLLSGSTLEGLVVLTGNGSGNLNFIVNSEQEYTKANMRGLYMLDESANITLQTMQHHAASHTTSDVIFKGILHDKAQSNYTGMIHIEKDVQRVVASQENKNMLFSSRAHATSIPSLQILSHDVQCSHGSAVGYFDEQQFFYAQARGCTSKQARLLLLEGFLADILMQLPSTMLYDIKKYITVKFSSDNDE